MRTIVGDIAASVEQARKNWGWYLALGILLILVGIYAIWAGEAATIAAVVALGIVLLIAGIGQLVGAFMVRGAGHVILSLLIGVLDIVVGLILIGHPALGALTITLFLAALFVFAGIFRFISALWLQYPQYGWAAASGFVTFLLGVLLWAQWPISAVWFPGFAVGVNFIFAGVAWTAMGLRLKSGPAAATV
jgi:uncharacterized membrane protein HdeD (DUF308 family)